MGLGAAVPTEPDSRGVRYALLLAITLMAFALRFWHLGDWGFDSDEIFMLRDSLRIKSANARPLMYLLNHYLINPILPLNEFSLRLLPATFGVLGIPVLYLVTRRLVGTRAALFAALLLALSGLHVYYSQFARYWSLVFMLCAIYPYAIYLGFRNRNRRLVGLGVAVGALAVLAHPASVLPAGGLALWLTSVYLRPTKLTNFWRERGVRWGLLILGLLVVGAGLRFIPLLRAWIVERDTIPRGEFLLSLPVTPGVKQVLYLFAYVESLSLALALTGIMGLYLLWQRRDRSLAVLLGCMFVFPIAFLVLLSFRTPVSTFYLVPTLPIMFIAAGVLLDHVAGVDWGLRPRWLVAAALAILIVAAGAPTLISQYRDGRRYDFRGAANWLQSRLGAGDIVLSDQSEVTTYYLKGYRAGRLVADPQQLTRQVRSLNETTSLWIVAPYSAKGGHRTNPKLGGLKNWIYDNCRLRHVLGVARLDFRVNELQIFQCPDRPTSKIALRRSSESPAQYPLQR